MRQNGNSWEIKKLYCDSGDEAEVCLALSNFFPGIGGDIYTEHMAFVAIRQEKSHAVGHGNIVYMRHAVLQKLDDFFHRRRRYLVQHIPRSFGSATLNTECGPREMSCYQWSFGNEGFCWRTAGRDSAKEPIVLDEWNEFISSFAEAGIDLQYDCTVIDGEASKNIIHMMNTPIDFLGTARLNCLWRRIDFGARSMIIQYETLARFIRNRREDMIAVFGSRGGSIGQDRYDMLRLLVKLLADGRLNDFEAGQLELLIKHFRISTLRDQLISSVGEDTHVAPLCLVEEID
jgi:hypothetical protein